VLLPDWRCRRGRGPIGIKRPEPRELERFQDDWKRMVSKSAVWCHCEERERRNNLLKRAHDREVAASLSLLAMTRVAVSSQREQALILCHGRTIHHPPFGPHCVPLRRKHFNTEKQPRTTKGHGESRMALRAKRPPASDAHRLRAMGHARHMVADLPPAGSVALGFFSVLNTVLADVIRSGAVDRGHRRSDISCAQP
jgi:hypothetical protein